MATRSNTLIYAVALPSVLVLGIAGFFLGALLAGDSFAPFPFILPIALNLLLGYSLEKKGKEKLGNLIIVGGMVFAIAAFLLIVFLPR